MEASSRWAMLGIASILGVAQLLWGTVLLIDAVKHGSGYAFWAAAGLAGGVFVLIGLAMLWRRPAQGGALAYVGAVLGVTLWAASLVSMLLTSVLLVTVLGLTLLYHQLKTASEVRLAAWILVVLLFGISMFGLLFFGGIATSALPWFAVAAVTMSLPGFGLMLAVQGSVQRA